MSRRYVLGAVAGSLLFLFSAGQALAFDCFVANKPTGAGSVGVVDIFGGETFTPGKNNPGTEEQPHAGFVTLDFGGEQYDVFTHQILPPVRDGGSQQNCDGKGIDSTEICLSQ